jgi:hypothetical protein
MACTQILDLLEEIRNVTMKDLVALNDAVKVV